MDGKGINHKEEFEKRIAELQASRKEREEKAKKKVGYWLRFILMKQSQVRK